MLFASIASAYSREPRHIKSHILSNASADNNMGMTGHEYAGVVYLDAIASILLIFLICSPLLAPREMQDRNRGEAVARIRNTSDHFVPRNERGSYSEASA